MRVIVCLEDNGGMAFNNRRQSRDRVLNADVVTTVGERRLFISPYSKMLFEDSEAELCVTEDFLEVADDSGYCFVEDRALAPYSDRISEVIVYRWNRRYPGDRYFDLDLDALGLKCAEIEEFAGYSHEKITKERYVK